MTLQLYVFRQLLVSLVFAMAGISLIVLPTLAIQSIHRLGAVSMVAVFSYMPLVLVELVPYVLPMAFLLAVVGTYGRLAAERELVAIRMAGIHPARMCIPGLILALALGAWTHHLLTDVSPEWKYTARNFLRQVERDAFTNFAQGKTELEFGDSSLKAERRYGNEFHGVLLDLTDADGEELTVTADVAVPRIEDGILFILLQNAHVLSDNARLGVEAPFWSRPLDELFPYVAKKKSDPKYLRSSELAEILEADTELQPEDRRDFVFEIHRRHALSAIYVLFLLVGAPTGIALRSSTQLAAFTGAMGYGFAYFVLAIRLGKELALAGLVPPVGAAWATNAIFLVLGAFLARRALWR